MSWLNKSFVTNLVALIVSIIGILLGNDHVKTIGYYAISGAITNWIAIFMLFEKIPFVYGSGIIPNRFESFKKSIKNLIIHQFFNEKNIAKFFQSEVVGGLEKSTKKILDIIDYDKLFSGFVDAIMSSQFGGVISSFLGGKEALAPMKDDFIIKIKKVLEDMVTSENVQEKIKSALPISPELVAKQIEGIVDSRLEELTPKMVKDIIQKMIRMHLGWLVVWGGIFGGIIGLVASYM